MSIFLNPMIITMVAEQRRQELRAQADRDRLAYLIRRPDHGDRRQWWSAQQIVVALAPLLTASSAVAKEVISKI